MLFLKKAALHEGAGANINPFLVNAVKLGRHVTCSGSDQANHLNHKFISRKIGAIWDLGLQI
jgi:hypothetical protein